MSQFTARCLGNQLCRNMSKWLVQNPDCVMEAGSLVLSYGMTGPPDLILPEGAASATLDAGFLVRECVDKGPGWSRSGRSRHADDANSPKRAPGTCSFAGDTGVLLADGSTKPIANIVVGDQVLAADPETGDEGGRTVTAVWSHEDRLVDLKFGDDVVTTTEDHPFWNASDGEWQAAEDLDAGEAVLTADGDLVAVDGIDWTTRTGGMAYNLTVADLHTYLVAAGKNQVLVHNDCKPNPPKCSLPPDIAKTFRDGYYDTETLTGPMTLYRVYGGGSEQMGRYWTDVPPSSSDSARRDLALPDENAATDIVTINVPAGTTIHKGIVAPDFGSSGGGTQVVFWPEYVQPNWMTSCSKLK